MEPKIEGLELRDYFAIQILSALVSRDGFVSTEIEAINYAYKVSDMMVKESNRHKAERAALQEFIDDIKKYTDIDPC